MSFSKDLKKESDNAIKATEETIKVVAIELFSGVITSSPVGAPETWKNPNSASPGYSGGAFRSNFFLTFGEASDKTTTATNEAESRLNEIKGIANAKYSTSYVLSNNLSYAERIENGWSHQQAPQGVIAPNVARITPLIPRIEKTVNAKYGVS